MRPLLSRPPLDASVFWTKPYARQEAPRSNVTCATASVRSTCTWVSGTSGERSLRKSLRTPVLSLPWPGPAPAHAFWIKCENLQPMGAFKIRGAYNMLAQLPAEVRARGVITYSSGNHGQGVAMAAQAMGVPAVVVMPTTAPGVKVEGVRRYGAEVIFAGTTSIDRQERAEAEAAARGLTVIPPFDHPMVIAGPKTTMTRFSTGTKAMTMQANQATTAVRNRPRPWRRWKAPRAVFLLPCMTIAMMKPMIVT